MDLEPEAISEQVVERLLSTYREALPLLPGAVQSVERLAATFFINGRRDYGAYD